MNENSQLKNTDTILKLPLTGGLALLGEDVVIFIISNMAAVVRSGQTSLNILSYLVHQLRFRADVSQIPQQRQALPVVQKT
jgi:hypothetical protein